MENGKQQHKVKLPDAAINRAKVLLQRLNSADSAFKIYLEGCKAGLGLDGDYNLNTQSWVFAKMDKPVAKDSKVKPGGA